MVIDPILGVDTSAADLTAYQIPLASQPVLAPEWKPKGKYGSVLHPDNIPTVFGTLQAHNNKVPQTVQALSTDGKKNLNVNIAGSDVGGGSGLGDITAFTHVFDEALNTNEPYAASPAFMPLQGITAIQFWCMGAAMNEEWQPQYIHLHVGPAGTSADPILLIVAPFHDNHAADASPQFMSAHAELSFAGYVNQAGAWKGTALKASVENASPGFGWLDGAGCTIYYV